MCFEQIVAYEPYSIPDDDNAISCLKLSTIEQSTTDH